MCGKNMQVKKYVFEGNYSNGLRKVHHITKLPCNMKVFLLNIDLKLKLFDLDQCLPSE